MTLSDSQKAGAASLFLAIASAVAFGLLVPTGNPDAGHIVVHKDGGNAPDAVGVWVTARAGPQALALFGVDAGGAPFIYVRAKICASPIDGGVDPGPSLGGDVDVVYDDDVAAPCTVDEPALEAWTQGRPDAPFPCACSTGPACLQGDGGPAPTGRTLQAGEYVAGAACLPKACVELAGASSWDARCAP